MCKRIGYKYSGQEPHYDPAIEYTCFGLSDATKDYLFEIQISLV